jgi:hypothetical protein
LAKPTVVVSDKELGHRTPDPAMPKKICAEGKGKNTTLQNWFRLTPPWGSSLEVQQPWEKLDMMVSLPSGHATAGSRHRQSEAPYIIDHCNVTLCDNIPSFFSLSLLHVLDTRQVSHIHTYLYIFV